MIPNHKGFLEALQEKRKVSVRFFSNPDGGVIERVCAPVDYGLGNENADGLNRYWLWDYANEARVPLLGLLPDQVVNLQVLGAVFDPAHLDSLPAMGNAPATIVPLDQDGRSGAPAVG